MPIHDDFDHLERLFEDLRPFPQLEIVAVDSASVDKPQGIGEGVQLIDSNQKGRGAQIAFGVRKTNRSWIWILHADSRVSPTNVEELARAITRCRWGRFDVRLAGDRPSYRVVERMMNARSAMTSICTGDQGMFVQRSLLKEVGGVPEQSLMEDIELSKRLRKIEKPLRIRAQLATSVRKWEREGVLATIIRMWNYRLRYFLGTHPSVLYQDYYGRGRTK